MNEFEKWWNKEMDYPASKYEILKYSQKELKKQKKNAAEKAWDAALDEVRSRYNLYIEDMNTKAEEIDQKISELYNDY